MQMNHSENNEKIDISEVARENRMTLVCIFCSWLIVSMAGIRFFWMYETNTSYEAVVFFACLFVPWLIGFNLYKRNTNSLGIRMHLYSSVLVFLLYVVVTQKPVQFVLVIFPIMMSTIAYCDIRLTFRFDLSVIIIVATGIVVGYLQHINPDETRFRLYVLIIIIGTSLFLLLCIQLMEKMQKRRNEAINKERDRFQAIVSVGVARIFEYDIANDMLMHSESSGGIYGKEQYICNFCSVAKSHNYVPFSDWYKLDEMLIECKSGAAIIDKEIRMKDVITGEFRWYRLKARVIFDEQGESDKLIGTIEDIDDAKKLEFRLADEKMRDPMTKLYKKIYLTQFVDEHLKKGNDSMAALLILDIDDYKKINEEMGTVFGDEILKNIAEDIQQLFFESDLVGRTGNDEFVIFMKNISSIPDVEKKVREIQDVISNTYIGEGIKRYCTVSIGAALYPVSGNDYNSLYINAEKALNLAQSKGPNHYDIYDAIKENVYSILADEQSSRRNKRMEQEKKSYVTDSIIELAFKLIDESKDTDSAINLLIRQMARQMNVGSIVIKTRIKGQNAMKIMYSYGVDYDGNYNIIQYSDEQWNSTLDLYNDNGIAICGSINEDIPEDVRQYMMAFGIESFVGCSFFERGEFAGTIDFLDFETERKWTKEEVREIKAVTNVVSSYLLKMKAYEDASETVERLTGYDSVTGLYKYEKFLGLAGEYLKSAEHGNYAMAYMDMFNFKYLNDTYGYETGDSVLCDMASMVLSHSEYVVMGSRVFSDNMVALIKLNDLTIEELKQGIERATKEFSDVMRQRLSDSRMEIGVGLCLFSVSGGPVHLQNIISNANMARKRTKLPMMPRCIIYNEQMGHAAKNEIAYANDMENAVKNREFVIFMQPKVNLKNNRIEGAEALVRWRKPDGSIIFPNDFIPVFERNKSVTQLDFYVYEEVCRYIRNRLDKKLPVVRVSANVSRVHLYAIDTIIEKVSALIREYNIPPEYLEFELTETSFTDKVADTISLLTRLRELGVVVSMDDFGSGYSSLNVLTKLPLDVLKIDKEFLRDFETDSEEKIVIPSVIAMAKKLNLEVVCEGVETAAQVEFLRDIDCDYAQGYYYSKPIPQEDFDAMLEDFDKNAG